MPLPLQDIQHVLEYTKPLWEQAKRKKIFLTGGTGFVGKWLLESFIFANNQLSLDAQITILSRNPEPFKVEYPSIANSACISFHKGDVRNFDFPKNNFDFIIHAATDTNAKFNIENPLLVTETIINGTNRVLDFARQCKTKRFLFLSSGAVYGRQPDNLPFISEDYNNSPSPSYPSSAYGISKKTAEMLCITHHKQYGIETTIARCFALVGPYLNLNIHFAIGNFIRDAIKNKTIIVNGDGTPLRSYLYAADLAIWLWTILFNGQPVNIYNVGSDNAISIADLAKKVAEISGNNCNVKITKKSTQATERQRYIPSIDKARNELKLDCWIGLEEAIKRTMQFYTQKKQDTIYE